MFFLPKLINPVENTHKITTECWVKWDKANCLFPCATTTNPALYTRFLYTSFKKLASDVWHCHGITAVSCTSIKIKQSFTKGESRISECHLPPGVCDWVTSSGTVSRIKLSSDGRRCNFWPLPQCSEITLMYFNLNSELVIGLNAEMNNAGGESI